MTIFTIGYGGRGKDDLYAYGEIQVDGDGILLAF
jgi:hypothetical protein